MSKFIVGVDVGGTNVKLGLVNAKGNIVDRSSLNTKSFISNKNKLIAALLQSIDTLILQNNLKNKDITGIGFGLPGLIDFEKGNVIFLPNIPGWKNVSLKKIIEKETKVRTFIDNDVNVITLGEWIFGAGKGYSNLVCMTLGTGVGGGLIFDNKLYRGEGFVAGEVGHIPINENGPVCNCGGRGCFEVYVGNERLLSKARLIFNNHHIDLPDIFKMANQGNRRAIQFWDEVGMHIGNALVGVVNLLNPPLVVIGGGVSNNFKFFEKSMMHIIKTRAMKVQAQMVKVVRAQLGDDAGILGVKVLVNNALKH